MPIDVSHRQGSSTQYHTKVSHREDQKTEEHKAKYLTGKVPQPKTTQWYRTEKIEKKQHKAKSLTGKVPQSKTQENGIGHRGDRKEAAQGQVSHRQSFHKRRQQKGFADREDGKETAQGQVSYRQCSSTENNRMVWNREDRKEKEQ